MAEFNPLLWVSTAIISTDVAGSETKAMVADLLIAAGLTQTDDGGEGHDKLCTRFAASVAVRQRKNFHFLTVSRSSSVTLIANDERSGPFS